MLSTMTDEQIMEFWEWLGKHETERLLTLLLNDKHFEHYDNTDPAPVKRPKGPLPKPDKAATAAAVIGRYLYQDPVTGKSWTEPCVPLND